MKKIFTLILFAVFSTTISTHAQTPFPTIDSVNINRINASVLVHGDMWWNPSTMASKCTFPTGSGKNIAFASSLWMSAYDAGSQLHIAAQTYRQSGNDYWPGPLDATDSISYSNSQKWAKIWKVNRTDINTFRALAAPTITNTPSAILTWPASGNVYAAGNAGVALTIPSTTAMAPFVDINNNGIYEPLLGEYPDVPGDQALWWVFNDNGPNHGETNGRPLRVEIHALSYAYSRGTLIDNVVYYSYKIINRSANSYNNFRLTQFADMDLGYFEDDYIGFDSSHRMGIVYNGSANDGAGAGGPPNSFGTHIPMAGVTLISVLPTIDSISPAPVGAFTYYVNDNSIIGNPAHDTDYDHYMRGRLRNGSHFTNDFAGAGVPSVGYGSGPNVNAIFTGDPSIATEWSECVANNMPGDRRFLISTPDFDLAPGQYKTVTLALITTNPDTLNACPGGHFSTIKTIADTAWDIYHHPLPSLDVITPGSVSANSILNVYPNPAHDKLIIETSNNLSGNESISVMNAIGQNMIVNTTLNHQKTELDISLYPAGLYHVLYRNGTEQATIKFIKE